MTDADSHFQILDRLAAYCHAVDGRDYELLASILSPDAVLEIGRARFEGRDAVVETIRSAGSKSEPGKHVGINARVHFDGDTATVTSGFLSFRADRSLHQAGSYLDRFERSEGEWRLANRRIVIELK
jgi:ketosteroid isomerase-like protein